MRISDWSSDVCSSDLIGSAGGTDPVGQAVRLLQVLNSRATEVQGVTTRMYEMATLLSFSDYADGFRRVQEFLSFCDVIESKLENIAPSTREPILHEVSAVKMRAFSALLRAMGAYLTRSEEHTSELQSLMRISYSVFCLKKK